MVRRHEDEAQLSRQRRASTVRGAQGNGGRGGNRKSGEGNPTKGMGGGGKETADRVARHLADYK